MVKLLLESNKELKNINDKLFLSNNVFKGKLKNHQEFLTKHMNEDNKNKHKDDANKISNLTDQTNETKNIDKSETEIIAKENNSTNETVLKNNIDINVELDKIEKIQEFIKNKNVRNSEMNKI